MLSVLSRALCAPRSEPTLAARNSLRADRQARPHQAAARVGAWAGGAARDRSCALAQRHRQCQRYRGPCGHRPASPGAGHSNARAVCRLKRSEGLWGTSDCCYFKCVYIYIMIPWVDVAFLTGPRGQDRMCRWASFRLMPNPPNLKIWRVCTVSGLIQRIQLSSSTGLQSCNEPWFE